MMEQRQGQPATSSPGHRWAFALAAGAFLAAALMWLLVLAPGSTRASGPHHHGHHHHHRLRVPSGFLGVLPGPTPFDDGDAAKIAATKVTAARVGLQWFVVQREKGPINFTSSDITIARLAEQGIAAIPTLEGTPRWVADKGTTAPVGGQAARDAWQTFVTAVIGRYGPNGTFWKSSGGASPFHKRCGCSAPPLPVKAVQIWNEPNLKHYFTPRPSPKAYSKLVKLSRSAIDDADSDVKLILAGLAGGNSGKPGDIKAVPYLKRLYKVRGLKQSFDGTALHPYSRNIAEMRTTISQFRKVMKKKRDSRTPLWLTEIGWGSKHPDKYGINKGLRGQKRMLQKAMKLVLSKRKAWRIAHVYWFFWRDPPKTGAHFACSFCSSAGLLKNDRRAKPAYNAFARLAKKAH